MKGKHFLSRLHLKYFYILDLDDSINQYLKKCVYLKFEQNKIDIL